jgi:FAD:protein FMN transferase
MSPRDSQITRRRLLAISGAGALASCIPAGVSATESVRVLEGAAFGTHWRITLPDNAVVDTLQAQVVALTEKLDKLFSPWRPDSVLARFNASEASAIIVPQEFAEVAARALALAEASGGLFDPTVGPLVARWGFGPIVGNPAQPDWRGLAVEDDRLVRKTSASTLDLCGIAKGHALDRIVTLLEQAGYDDFLIDLGGELGARGRHPSGRAWQVAVESPEPGAQEAIKIVALKNCAVATSGDRINAYEIGGRRYSHIIDPTTSEPVATTLSSVSVIANSGLEADGWATALMASGDDGPNLARRYRICALFVIRSDVGLIPMTTGDFDRLRA